MPAGIVYTAVGALGRLMGRGGWFAAGLGGVADLLVEGGATAGICARVAAGFAFAAAACAAALDTFAGFSGFCAFSAFAGVSTALVGFAGLVTDFSADFGAGLGANLGANLGVGLEAGFAFALAAVFAGTFLVAEAFAAGFDVALGDVLAGLDFAGALPDLAGLGVVLRAMEAFFATSSLLLFTRV